jgi:hypothetical protein
MESDIEDIQIINNAPIESILLLTLERVKMDSLIFIEMFGSLRTDPSPKAMLSTIKTATHLIMTLVIWSFLKTQSTCLSTVKRGLKTLILKRGSYAILRRFVNKLKSGMHRMRETSGTGLTGRHLLVNMPMRKWKPFAGVVEKIFFDPNSRSKQNFVGTTVEQRPGECPEQTMLKKLAHAAKRFLRETNTWALSFVRAPVATNVYNLGVETHSQYIANGILVHNCDALRYNLNGIPFDWEKIGTVKMSFQEYSTKKKSEVDERRERGFTGDMLEEDLIEQEIEFWNELMED